MKIVSKEEAVSVVKSDNNIFFQGAAMTPFTLIDALVARSKELNNVEIYQIHTHYEAKYMEAPYNEAFHLSSLFVGANVRKGVNSHSGSYIPVFLSDIHHLFRRNIIPLDVAFIQVSPPDKHGFCSLGTSVDVTIPAIATAKLVVAQINPRVPRSHGDGVIHQDKIDLAIEVDTPIYSSPFTEPNETDEKIGKHVAELIEDGSTLQMGIGNIPNAVLSN